ncbi:AP-1 complex subunit mu-1 isoform X1 [Myotis lucifugus]|uniref:AP-1 complex subunit mu-1 isoform X1 n=1 Tax=Myotis lucifugus TaxID=59463 RepID=UPI000CCC26A1|nr:AP-1 complex subunit mu-1 isoform X1 [Myotis lucifugus]
MPEESRSIACSVPSGSCLSLESPLTQRPRMTVTVRTKGKLGRGRRDVDMGLLTRLQRTPASPSVVPASQGVKGKWICAGLSPFLILPSPIGLPPLPTSQVFSEYFKELEEESIRDNFVIIYELLDELMDFGYPQTTDSKILQEYITQEGHKLETGAPRPPATVTNAVSWRSEGIKYRKNEVFLDVIESVNLLVSANGNVLRSEIVGSIKMRVFLSGMPELRLGLNDKVLFDNTGRGKSKSVELEDVKFHQCVRLSRFENDRTISFIPPDGEFELMSYRLNTHVKPLIWIESVIEKHSHSRIEYMIKAKSQFKRRSTANNVEIHIPVPNDADSPKFKTTVGSVKWVPENSEIVWSIKSFPITSSGPSEGSVPQPWCRGSWGSTGRPAKPAGRRTPRHRPPPRLCRETPPSPDMPALPSPHLSPKPLLPEEARLPGVLSLCPSPSWGGKRSLCPEATRSLGAESRHQEHEELARLLRGTVLPSCRSVGLCLMSVSGVLSSSSLLFT